MPYINGRSLLDSFLSASLNQHDYFFQNELDQAWIWLRLMVHDEALQSSLMEPYRPYPINLRMATQDANSKKKAFSVGPMLSMSAFPDNGLRILTCITES